MSIGESFRDVLEAARTGAEWALEVLYRDLAPVVLGYLRAQGAAEPDDLTSEVFVGIVRNISSFEGDERSFRAWVFSIAHRRLLDERRRLARRREDTVDPGELAALARMIPSAGVEREILPGLEGGVLQAISSLRGDQRAVFLLRVMGDLSVAEVASILGKSEGAVKMLQRRALQALARRIEREDVT